MSFRLSRFRSGAAAIALGLAFCGPGPLRGADSPAPQSGSTALAAEKAPALSEEPLESSRPDRSGVEDRFMRKPETFDSMFGRRRPVLLPAPLVIPNNQSKDPLDQESNWVFTTPEEVIHDFMIKELLKVPEYGPDGRRLDSLTAVERYYLRTSHGSGATNSAPRSDPLGLQKFRDEQERPESADAAGPLAVFGKMPSAMKEISMTVLTGGPIQPETTSSPFGVTRRDDQMTPEVRRERKEQEDHLEEFKRILNFQQPPAPARAVSASEAAALQGSALTGISFEFDRAAAYPGLPFSTMPGQLRPALTPVVPTVPLAPRPPVAPGLPDLFAPAPALSSTKQAPKSEFALPQRRF